MFRIQTILCVVTLLLCCRGTHGSNPHVPGKNVLSVYLTPSISEYAIKFVDRKGNKIGEEKTYKASMEIQWDTEMFYGAIKVLWNRLQSQVDSEKVEEILRNMDCLSTDRNKMQSRSENTQEERKSHLEIKWSTEEFDKAVQMLEKDMQCNVSADDVEEILHIMYSLSTGRINMLHASERIKKEAEWNKQERMCNLTIMWDAEIFDMAYEILGGNEHGRVVTDDMVEILHLMEYLCIREELEGVCYGKLAMKTMDDHKESEKEAVVEYREYFRERMLEWGRDTKLHNVRTATSADACNRAWHGRGC